MKTRVLIFMISSCFTVSYLKAQHKDNREYLDHTIIDLLKKKHKYDEIMSFKRPNPESEYKRVADSVLSKSEYGAAIKKIKANPSKYLAYIDNEISANAENLGKEYILYEKLAIHDSGAPDKYTISKLDYLKAIRYSLFEKKGDRLLNLYKIPGIKLKYPIPNSSAIRTVNRHQ